MAMALGFSSGTCELPPSLLPPYNECSLRFPSSQQALRTIIFNTNSHLSQNAGVLIAWMLISGGTTTLFTWLVRAQDVRRVRKFDSEHGSAGIPNPKGKYVDPVAENKNWEVRVDEKGVDEKEVKGRGITTAFARWEKLKCNKSKDQSDQNIEMDGPAGGSTVPPNSEHPCSSL